MYTSRTSIGLAIIAVGVLLFGQQYHWWWFSFEQWWPLFVVLPGLGMFASATMSGQTKRAGIFIPASILTILGLYFFFETWTSWATASTTAFIYPLSVAIGFLLASEKATHGRGGLRFVMWLCLIAAGITLLATVGQTKYWPIALIILGLALMFRPRRATSVPVPPVAEKEESATD